MAACCSAYTILPYVASLSSSRKQAIGSIQNRIFVCLPYPRDCCFSLAVLSCTCRTHGISLICMVLASSSSNVSFVSRKGAEKVRGKMSFSCLPHETVAGNTLLLHSSAHSDANACSCTLSDPPGMPVLHGDPQWMSNANQSSGTSLQTPSNSLLYMLRLHGSSKTSAHASDDMHSAQDP